MIAPGLCLQRILKKEAVAVIRMTNEGFVAGKGTNKGAAAFMHSPG